MVSLKNANCKTKLVQTAVASALIVYIKEKVTSIGISAHAKYIFMYLSILDGFVSLSLLASARTSTIGISSYFFRPYYNITALLTYEKFPRCNY